MNATSIEAAQRDPASRVEMKLYRAGYSAGYLAGLEYGNVAAERNKWTFRAGYSAGHSSGYLVGLCSRKAAIIWAVIGGVVANAFWLAFISIGTSA